MKKTLLALALVAGFSYGASAQCTPDTTHFTSTTKVYPASLPNIITGQSFSGTVTMQVPDTMDAGQFISAASGYQAYIDSIQITTISGMPAGITTASLPGLGTWLQHGQWSCTTFSGTANASTVAAGDYNLTISGTGCGHFSIGSTPYSGCQAFTFSRVYPYKLTVAYPAGIQEVLNGVDMKIFPNPNQGSFNVTISADDRITGDINVMDALGRTIHTEALDVTGTKQIALDLGNVSSGVYMLVVNTANGKAVRQFTVK
ncbi:MAG: T9SS type A sorting domain-containing protein [Bacteroidetes bacterium]|nr:T9SS type A sorting domain-containing protein [Bacteroidota bacterium]